MIPRDPISPIACTAKDAKAINQITASAFRNSRSTASYLQRPHCAAEHQYSQPIEHIPVSGNDPIGPFRDWRCARYFVVHASEMKRTEYGLRSVKHLTIWKHQLYRPLELIGVDLRVILAYYPARRRSRRYLP